MNNLPIHVTSHAMTRFRQRFSLIFNREVLDRRDFVTDLFKKSQDDVFRLKMAPGMYNSLCVKAGHPIVERTYKGFLKFVGFQDKDRIVIVTIWKIDNRKVGYVGR